jgi:hypothetical protein
LSFGVITEKESRIKRGVIFGEKKAGMPNEKLF